MKPIPCPTDLNQLDPGDACPICAHDVLAHARDSVCGVCRLGFLAGFPPAWASETGTAQSSTDPQISTR